MNEFKLKLLEKIGEDSFESWFAPKPAVFEGAKEKYKAREGAKFHSPFYGVLVIEVHSRFFKDQIISRFGSAIHEVATSLGFKIAHVLTQGEEIPRAEPPLTPEQWSELKGVLTKIGNFARSAGNRKASSALFTQGVEEDIVEEPKPTLKPAYVYKGKDVLGSKRIDHSMTTPEQPTLGNQGVIFPVIINQAREEI